MRSVLRSYGRAMTDALTDLAEYREEMRRYYSNIVGKYGGMVQKRSPNCRPSM